MLLEDLPSLFGLDDPELGQFDVLPPSKSVQDVVL